MSISSNNRSLVNFIGIPAILLLLWIGGPLFGIFIGIVVTLAIGEFLRMTKADKFSLLKWISYAGGIGFCLYFYYLPKIEIQIILLIFGLVTIFVFIVEMFQSNSNPTRNLSVSLFAIIYIGMLLSTLIGLRNIDKNITIMMVLSIWTCDSAAFYFGTRWGKKKILPSISPKKSWVGCIAGFCSTFLVFGIANKLNVIDISYIDVFVLSIITGIFGQAGDFAESLLKRNAGIKDSGRLLLGHGGVLDRFDSLIFASPLTFYYIYFYVDLL